MNAQERRRRKRRKQMQRRFGALIPIAVIILLIAGLTAGGVILSINQTKKGYSDVTDNSGNNADDGTDEVQEPDETDEATDIAEEQTTAEPVPADEDIFEEMLADMRIGLEGDDTYLTAANGSFVETLQILEGMDTSVFSQENKDLYDVILDYMKVESIGSGYVNNAPAPGQRMVDVAGGTDYYVWLVKKLSGTSKEMQVIHDSLANELNVHYGIVNGLMQSDVMLAQNSKSHTKNVPDQAYLFGTVTASSDTLQTALKCDALANGWTEFGIIRAYQNDSAVDAGMREYLISSTRMAYAMYGLVDFYVHYSSWTIDQVTELCNRYFGGGQEAFAQSLYQMVLDNPGRFASAGVGFLELVDIETTLRNNVADYGEQILLDFLFGRGPASFRVYWNWLNPGTAQ